MQVALVDGIETTRIIAMPTRNAVYLVNKSISHKSKGQYKKHKHPRRKPETKSKGRGEERFSLFFLIS